jgi:regulator of replication initiation timing
LNREEDTLTHSGWINAEDLLRERAALRTELARLRTENERLRDALVEEVVADVQDHAEHMPAESCVSSTGC